MLDVVRFGYSSGSEAECLKPTVTSFDSFSVFDFGNSKKMMEMSTGRSVGLDELLQR